MSKLKRIFSFFKFTVTSFARWLLLPVKIALIVAVLIFVNEYYFSNASVNHRVVVQYLDTLKWPLLALVVYVLLRNELPDVIKRITSIGRDGVVLTPSPQYQPSQSDEDEEIREATNDTTYDVSDPKDRQELLKQAPIALALEKIYRIIFGSQIAALLRLAAFDTGLKSAQLQEFYDSHTKRMPRTSNKNIHDLLAYPSSVSLIEYNHSTDTYQITNIGRLFLEYLQSENISDPILKSW